MTYKKKCRLLTELGHNIVTKTYHYPYGDRFVICSIDDIEYYVRHSDQVEAHKLVDGMIDHYIQKGDIRNERTTHSIL